MAYSLKNVIKGSLIISSAKILTKASGFFLIPLYTRYLTPVDYGIMGYLEVVFKILSTLLMFGFYGAQTRLYYDHSQDKEQVGKLLFTLNIILFFSLLIFCTTATFFGGHIYSIIGSDHIPFLPYFPVKTWTLFFQILNQMVIVYYMTVKKYKICALIQIFQFFAITVTVIIFVAVFNEGALGRFKGVLIGQILCFLFCYPSYFKLFKFKISKKVVRFAFAFGLPVVIHLLASVVFELIDRVILEKYVSIDELGIYTLGYQIGMVGSILVVSLNNAYAPNFYELMKENQSNKSEKVKTVFYAMVILMGAICIIGSLYSKEYLQILVTPKYYGVREIIPIILFSYFIQGFYFFGVQSIFYYNKTKFMPFITISAAVVNISLNYLLIPLYGILGAAYATAASNIYLSIIVHIIGRKYFNPHYNYIKISAITFYLFLTCCIVKFDAISIPSQIYKILLFIMYLLICYKIFGSYFSFIRQKIINKTNRGYIIKKMKIMTANEKK